MIVNDLIQIFRGSQQYVPLLGLTDLDLVQITLDKIYAVDADVRLIQPPPYIVTTAGTLAYDWDDLVPGVSNMRRIRGIFEPGLSSTTLGDYGYTHTAPVFDQTVISRRFYYRGIFLNQEQRRLTFLSDPGDTTTTWQVDYYENAPTVADNSRVPVLPGWELDLVYTGMMAWFEESKTLTSDYWVPLFQSRKTAYYDKLKVENQLQGQDENGNPTYPPAVIPI